MDINRGGGRTRLHMEFLHSKSDHQADPKSPMKRIFKIASPDLVTMA